MDQEQPNYTGYEQTMPITSTNADFSAHPQPGMPGLRQGAMDMVFPSFAEGLQSPIGHLPAVPMSARWDGLFDSGLDMSGNGEYDGLDFGAHDAMLHDFGSALAQAETMSSW